MANSSHRAFLFVLDSVGIGGAPDARVYGDEGADTLGHVALACSEGRADLEGMRRGPLQLPNLEALGLGLAARLATGEVPAGFSADPQLVGTYASAKEVSKGKDTPSGHWEIAGVPVLTDWGYFEARENSFPDDLLREIIHRAAIPGILGNKHASGTDIIRELGETHISTGKPICYTSSDSVFQIAAHERHFGLDRLYALCQTVFELTAPMRIGRVIARPFVGEHAENFERTGNRRDFSIKPPSPTLLDVANGDGREVVAIGKIADIYAHCGPTRVIKANGNAALFEATADAMDGLPPGGLLMTNFVDFDQLYGHRRDVAGYAAALETFDGMIPKLRAKMRAGDVMIFTADHGNDPTWRGTDHTREQVPVLICGHHIKPGSAGVRDTFADIGATIASHLDLPTLESGTPIL